MTSTLSLPVDARSRFTLRIAVDLLLGYTAVTLSVFFLQRFLYAYGSILSLGASLPWLTQQADALFNNSGLTTPGILGIVAVCAALHGAVGYRYVASGRDDATASRYSRLFYINLALLSLWSCYTALVVVLPIFKMILTIIFDPAPRD